MAAPVDSKSGSHPEQPLVTKALGSPAESESSHASVICRTGAMTSVGYAAGELDNKLLIDMGIGGLTAESRALLHRAFTSRLSLPAANEQPAIKRGKGVLLCGASGTGKTLMAHAFAQRLMNGRYYTAVNATEIVAPFIGEASPTFRIFANAEAAQKEMKDKSDLHVFIFENLDTLCSNITVAGATAGSSVEGGNGACHPFLRVLLSKMDGANALNNTLVIGTTTRKDLILPALFMPGRFDVSIETVLPDTPGREEILRIHTKKMEDRKSLHDDVDLHLLAKETKGLNQTELSSLVKKACSCALDELVGEKKLVAGASAAAPHSESAFSSTKPDLAALKVRRAHFELALEHIRIPT